MSDDATVDPMAIGDIPAAEEERMPQQSIVPLLRVSGLSGVIETPNGTARILKDISFDLERGETLGLVGESGSGKTMLVKSLMGISPPAVKVKGSAVLNGVDLLTAPISLRRQVWGRQIAMVFQDPMSSLNPVVRIGRQLTEGMRKHLGLSKDAAYERAVELLGSVGISDAPARMRLYPHELSGGMRQRVMIAIALSCDPEVLITDEATTALDVTVQKQILDLLDRLQRERGMSVIMVSHDLGVVAGRTSRVAVMYAGRMIESGPTAKVYRSTRHRYTQALLNAIPRIHEPGSGMKSIPGSMPNPKSSSPACEFAPRCAFAIDSCREGQPASVVEDDDHAYRCFVPVTDAERQREGARV